MKRLTIRNSDGTVSQPTTTSMEALFYCLAAYEDTGLEPEEIKEFEGVPIDRLRELAEADKEGRCVVLPCKVGDKLYDMVEYRNSGEMEIVERTVQSIEFFEENYYVKMYRRKSCKATNGVLIHRVDSWVKGTDINKTVFLTREAAETALKEREQNE